MSSSLSQYDALSEDPAKQLEAVKTCGQAVRKAVSKCISDSLKGMADSELGGTLDAGGLTCRQRLTLRRLQWTLNKKKYPMGKGFYAELLRVCSMSSQWWRRRWRRRHS